MKKQYTVFEVLKNGQLSDMGWTRYDKEEDAIMEAMSFDYDVELLVLPIYVPTKLQD